LNFCLKLVYRRKRELVLDLIMNITRNVFFMIVAWRKAAGSKI